MKQGAFHIWSTVVRREYVTRVRRRAFLVATLLGPVLWVGLVAGIVLLTQSTESPAKVWVVDHDGLLTLPAGGGQFVPTFPSCYPERSLLEYRFGRETKEADVLAWSSWTRAFCKARRRSCFIWSRPRARPNAGCSAT